MGHDEFRLSNGTIYVDRRVIALTQSGKTCRTQVQSGNDRTYRQSQVAQNGDSHNPISRDQDVPKRSNNWRFDLNEVPGEEVLQHAQNEVRHDWEANLTIGLTLGGGDRREDNYPSNIADLECPRDPTFPSQGYTLAHLSISPPQPPHTSIPP